MEKLFEFRANVYLFIYIFRMAVKMVHPGKRRVVLLQVIRRSGAGMQGINKGKKSII